MPLVNYLRSKLVARKKLSAKSDISLWSGLELLSLGLLLMRRLFRGLFVRLKLKQSHGFILCDRHVRLYHPRHIEAGCGFSLEEGCEIVGLSKQGVKFGQRCTVGRFATIRPTNVLFDEPGEGLVMGDYSNIGAYSYIGCSGLVSIGNNVMMGQRVTIQGENHEFTDTSCPICEQGVVRAPVVIGDNCWISSCVTILAGVHIGSGSVIGAGAVVVDDIPSNSVAVGVPAKVIRSRNENTN
jgi:acetyltransferase-like isoleucine patch superfamily enzyme